MNSKYCKNLKVSYTNINKKANLGIVNTSCLIQDATTEFFLSIGSDNLTIRKKNNAVWVIGKMKIHVNSYPMWQDEISTETYFTEISKIRTNAETKILDKNGNVLIVGLQEFCPIDLETRKIRKIDTVCFPNEIETYESVMTDKFEKINYDFKDNEKVFEEQVPWIDTDYSDHTNNISYIRYIMRTFDSDFLNKHNVKNFEVHFLNESKDGDNLSVYRRFNENKADFMIEKNDTDVVKARIKCKEA